MKRAKFYRLTILLPFLLFGCVHTTKITGPAILKKTSSKTYPFVLVLNFSARHLLEPDTFRLMPLYKWTFYIHLTGDSGVFTGNQEVMTDSIEVDDEYNRKPKPDYLKNESVTISKDRVTLHFFKLAVDIHGNINHNKIVEAEINGTYRLVRE